MEFGSRRNLESSKNPENTHPLEKQKSYEEHLKEMNRIINSLTEEDSDNISKEIDQETADREAELDQIRSNLDQIYSKYEKSFSTPKKRSLESRHHTIRDIDQPKDLEGREFHLSSEETAPQNEPTESQDTEPQISPITPTESPDAEPLEPDASADIPTATPELSQEIPKINIDVKKAIFDNSQNIEAMLGEDQYQKWQNIVNHDIESDKYQNATYEDELIYYIGNVNEEGLDTREDWDVMKYRTREEKEHYDAQINSIDPQVRKEIDKKIYILGATLGEKSAEYHDALNKINQDIDSGRYKDAKIQKNAETGETQLIFNESQPTSHEESPVLTTEPELEDIPATTVEPTPEKSAEPPYEQEMADIIKFEVRTAVDTLKTIYSRLDTATEEQKDRFNYLYRSLSEASKREITSKQEEQKKFDDIQAYSRLIAKLSEELG